MVLQVLHDVVFDGEVDSVRSEASKDDHLSERLFTLGLPFTGKLGHFRLCGLGAEPILPFLGAQVDCLADVSEVGQLLIKLL